MSPENLSARGEKLLKVAIAKSEEYKKSSGYGDIVQACWLVDEAKLDYQAAYKRLPLGQVERDIAYFYYEQAIAGSHSIRTIFLGKVMPQNFLKIQPIREMLYRLCYKHIVPTKKDLLKMIKQEYLGTIVLTEDDIDRIMHGFQGYTPAPDTPLSYRSIALPDDGVEIRIDGIGAIGQKGKWVLNRPAGTRTERPVFNLVDKGLSSKNVLKWSEIAPYLEQDNAELETIASLNGISRDEVLLIIVNRMQELLVRALEFEGEMASGLPNHFENMKYNVFMTRAQFGRSDVTIKYSIPESREVLTLRLNLISLGLASMGVFYKGKGGWDQNYPSSPEEFWDHHIRDHVSRLIQELNIQSSHRPGFPALPNDNDSLDPATIGSEPIPPISGTETRSDL